MGESEYLVDRDTRLSFRIFCDKANKAKKLSEENPTIKTLRNFFRNNHVGYIGISFQDCSVDSNCEIIDRKGLFEFHRNYLEKHPPEKDDFRSVMSKYFVNIYFQENIADTLNGLHQSYKKILKLSSIIFK